MDVKYRFLNPSEINLSNKVIELGEAFASSVGGKSKWILIFDWALSRAVRMSPTSPWQELPPGFDMGMIERKLIPAKAIFLAGRLEYVIRVPENNASDIIGETIDLGKDNMLAVT
jgi:hypothetical protein